VAAQKDLLPKADCGDNELCTPCYDPTTAIATGACSSVSCDAPKDPAPQPVSCPYTGPALVDVSKFPDCSPACGGAHCVPQSVVSGVDATTLAQLATCTGGYCVPDFLVETAANGVPKTCASIGGREGRCLSACLPSVADQAAILPKADCGDNELCTPCYDPTTAIATGACSTVSCDAPVGPAPQPITCPYTGPDVIDPTTLSECSPTCGGAHCMPESFVPVDLQSQLFACTGGFCLPDTLIRSGGEGVPSTCTSLAGAEGRCLSECLKAVSDQKDLLPVSTCAAGERCAPCYDPLSGDDTGSCSVASCDKPTKPPVIISCPYKGADIIDPTVFPDCSPSCGGAHCVPAAVIGSADPKTIAQLDTCAGGYCVPDSIVRTAAQGLPKSCTSVAGSEGRCLSTCLPAIGAQADLLPKSVCGTGEVCAPCYDPTAADPTVETGACSTVSCDKPLFPPTILKCPYVGPDVIDPSKFPACDPACGGAHCLPESYVPVAQQSLLAKCPGGYCAPDTIIRSAAHYRPPTCTAFAGTNAEGRCLSVCLPDVGSRPEPCSKRLARRTSCARPATIRSPAIRPAPARPCPAIRRRARRSPSPSAAAGVRPACPGRRSMTPRSRACWWRTAPADRRSTSAYRTSTSREARPTNAPPGTRATAPA
jgi:hypothetical protein